MIYDRITKENFYFALSFAREIFPYEFVNGKLSFEGAYRESIDLNQPEFAYYIVKNADNCPIGITGHYTEDDKMDKIWLGWFGVYPKCRGKGYGTEILRSTAKIVAKLGYNRMSIYSGQRIEEHNAHKLYVKNGFEKTGEGILEVESVFFFEGPVPVKISMEEMYRDQAGITGSYVSAFYTPAGIRRIDTLFCNRIMAFRNGEHYKQFNWDGKTIDHVWEDTKESLTKDITENNHLHEDIKENLLFNLNRED